MLNIDRALNDDRLMKSVIGLSVSEFNKLEESFREEFQNETWGRYETGVELGNRERKPGGGRMGNLTSKAEKLFFTLFYFKCYPTFDLLGFIFDFNRSNANRNTHKFTSILEKALGRVSISESTRIHKNIENTQTETPLPFREENCYEVDILPLDSSCCSNGITTR